uniref:Uncharacterized protein n=1 Tax=Sinocyclocheilus rhinocerous TaxID=307959 RepID=A0A673KJP6_9TELE
MDKTQTLSVCVLQEALLVVSEDQSLFECSYGAPHSKTDMTASAAGEYGPSKLSPRVHQQDWLAPPTGRVTVKLEYAPPEQERV